MRHIELGSILSVVALSLGALCYDMVFRSIEGHREIERLDVRLGVKGVLVYLTTIQLRILTASIRLVRLPV